MMWSWNCSSLNDMRMINFIGQRSPVLVLALLFTVCALFTDLAPAIEAQSNAQERANALRGQLYEVQTKRDALNARLAQLEEELRPENIEKSLAGIGSTRPEELRDLRRRQLELEKIRLQTQLKLLAESQTRLEAGIIQTDAHAYHESAGINPGRNQQISGAQQPAKASRVQRRLRRSRSKPKPKRIHRLTQG
jgi:outer membrane PBP1 activator LpoA protein